VHRNFRSSAFLSDSRTLRSSIVKYVGMNYGAAVYCRCREWRIIPEISRVGILAPAQHHLYVRSRRLPCRSAHSLAVIGLRPSGGLRDSSHASLYRGPCPLRINHLPFSRPGLPAAVCRLQTNALHKRRSAIGFSDPELPLALDATPQGANLQSGHSIASHLEEPPSREKVRPGLLPGVVFLRFLCS
jgi:hypothetical protein